MLDLYASHWWIAWKMHIIHTKLNRRRWNRSCVFNRSWVSHEKWCWIPIFTKSTNLAAKPFNFLFTSSEISGRYGQQENGKKEMSVAEHYVIFVFFLSLPRARTAAIYAICSIPLLSLNWASHSSYIWLSAPQEYRNSARERERIVVRRATRPIAPFVKRHNTTNQPTRIHIGKRSLLLMRTINWIVCTMCWRVRCTHNTYTITARFIHTLMVKWYEVKMTKKQKKI